MNSDVVCLFLQNIALADPLCLLFITNNVNLYVPIIFDSVSHFGVCPFLVVTLDRASWNPETILENVLITI